MPDNYLYTNYHDIFIASREFTRKQEKFILNPAFQLALTGCFLLYI